ncbi:hypothetical protein CVD25_14760 [Bacillus canaveralius]|uniref:Uncharacterized protein n=1 Tax=Bacillus canaveralius TaxID=1403243 RepID=A0A2N5GHP8_9BACI|nr:MULTISPECIES: hypothetical protein [Bacillus]PLR80303.1 hypothetical protein CU635_18470 [Bacillus canaveralius]PLR85784.1 hypothetical protein CVD23_07545 [Bacillus sp. V33-4]PLR95478.1 hypothetical protein CVD25_14760 [Bacillus canaveralius]RSK44052.1 hypothetical protein EJA13_20775 [Bacillus canaveralius]
MKEVLQQVRDDLENTFAHPGSASLDDSIRQLEEARQQYGDRGTMIEDVIRSVTHARNAREQLEHAGDISSTAAFGEAFVALDQAIESYTNPDNDPV